MSNLYRGEQGQAAGRDLRATLLFAVLRMPRRLLQRQDRMRSLPGRQHERCSREQPIAVRGLRDCHPGDERPERQLRGTHVVEFGPINASIHKVNEHIEVADIDRIKDVYRAILRKLLLPSP